MISPRNYFSVSTQLVCYLIIMLFAAFSSCILNRHIIFTIENKQKWNSCRKHAELFTNIIFFINSMSKSMQRKDLLNRNLLLIFSIELSEIKLYERRVTSLYPSFIHFQGNFLHRRFGLKGLCIQMDLEILNC